MVSRKRSVRTEVEEGKGRHRARVASDVLRQGQAGTLEAGSVLEGSMDGRHTRWRVMMILHAPFMRDHLRVSPGRVLVKTLEG